MTRDPNRRAGLAIQVHRFRDHVATYVGTGETVYLTPKQARAFARALNAACRDVDTTPFVESGIVPTTIEIN